MKISDLKDSDKGRRVIYRDSAGKKEIGILSSWNDEVIFARFSLGSTAAGCSPEDLEFEFV